VAAGGPNPIKVLIVLEALQIPYEKVIVQNPKEDWLVKINPNGRIPVIVDPNTDITIWESGAILEYLVETYDKEGKLTVTDAKDKWLLKQYLHFQMSGQVSFIIVPSEAKR
jgi:glutathione S-transferase